MAGTLFGLPLSQQMDDNGDPQSGALLYLYAASTSTPVISYADFGLTTQNSFPLECDSSGRIPQFWLDDGSYRARLTTAEGVEIFDIASIQAIGASVASTGGGGGGTAVDATTVFATGDMLWKPITGARTGWVRANARTIGSASSGGTERANADTQSLYEYLWNNFSNTLCPVTTGRGATAVADFIANKAIGTLDMRGRSIFGLDDMGNSAASVLVTGTPTTAASSTGAEKTTIAQANLPVANLSAAGLSVATAITKSLSVTSLAITKSLTVTDSTVNHSLSVGTSITNGTLVSRAANQQSDNTAGGAGNIVKNVTDATISLASGTVSGTASLNSTTVGGTATLTDGTVGGTATLTSGAVSGTVPLAGSGTAATTISPGRLGSWYLKLTWAALALPILKIAMMGGGFA